eukprot:m.182560 g.182560  ORF g.182560 m.182560 type:complete len:337 (+) comp18064_c4_seq4:831-1841(+)
MVGTPEAGLGPTLSSTVASAPCNGKVCGVVLLGLFVLPERLVNVPEVAVGTAHAGHVASLCGELEVLQVAVKGLWIPPQCLQYVANIAVRRANARNVVDLRKPVEGALVVVHGQAVPTLGVVGNAETGVGRGQPLHVANGGAHVNTLLVVACCFHVASQCLAGRAEVGQDPTFPRSVVLLPCHSQALFVVLQRELKLAPSMVRVAKATLGQALKLDKAMLLGNGKRRHVLLDGFIVFCHRVQQRTKLVVSLGLCFFGNLASRNGTHQTPCLFKLPCQPPCQTEAMGLTAAGCGPAHAASMRSWLLLLVASQTCVAAVTDSNCYAQATSQKQEVHWY